MNKRRDEDIVAILRQRSPGCYDPVTNLALMEEVPEEMRLLHYGRRSVPAEYRVSFGFYHQKIDAVRLHGLPPTMQRELMYVVWRIVEMGGRVPCAPLSLLTRELAATTRRLRHRGQPAESLMDLSPRQWKEELRLTWAQREKELPNPDTFRTFVSPLDRACKLLWFAYDSTPWWRREIWDLTMDPRIPRRPHEPLFTKAVHWHRITPEWLRLGGMFVAKMSLESGQLSWSTVHQRFSGLLVFGKFVTDRGIDSPRLCDDDRDLRSLMLEFLRETETQVLQHGKNAGKPRSRSNMFIITTAVRSLYTYMHDNGREAAHIIGDSRWEGLGPEFLRFWRPGDLQRVRSSRFDERHLLSDAVLSEVVKHSHILGDPREDGGLGDPQAMRILLLMIATGRRISEICMLDFSPIVPIAGQKDDSIAKLRYQQTKIDGAPDTIFVENEVVQIIAEQQKWLSERLAAVGITSPPPYLFVKYQNNLRGTHPYDGKNFRHQLTRLVERVDIRDHTGTPVRLSTTHRFRHTKATALIDAGVPLHVVQRYLGHATPEMTMHYAHTLDSTAKAEFLRFQKINRSGQAPTLTETELFDLLALDARTDRVLPNGWCTLPPSQTCEKGNACLTCDLFVTDRRFLPEHQQQLDSIDDLIDARQQAHRAQTGQPMPESHVWLTLRRREQDALRTIVTALADQDQPAALAGGGVPVRTNYDELKRARGA